MLVWQRMGCCMKLVCDGVEFAAKEIAIIMLSTKAAWVHQSVKTVQFV